MGSSVSREEDAKKLLQQGAITLPLGSQVERLFHEDLDDDAHAILTPLTPSTPALIGDDSSKKRWSLNSSKEQKWASVEPVVSQRNTLQVPASSAPGSEHSSIRSASSLAPGSSDLKETTAKDVSNIPEGGDQTPAALTQVQSTTSLKDLASKPNPSKTLTDISKKGADPGKGVTIATTGVQKRAKVPEHISPQSAVARIAKRMKAGTSSTSTRSYEDKAKHDSRLMSTPATSGPGTKPENVLPDQKFPGKVLKPIRRQELISPQVAVSRIAKRMSMNAMANSSAKATDDATRHDSKVLLNNATIEENSQPDASIPSPEHSSTAPLVESISVEDKSTSAVLETPQTRSRSLSPPILPSTDSLPQAVSPELLEDTSKVLIDDAHMTEVGATLKARWQERMSRRISDQRASDAEKKRLSQISDLARRSWLEDASVTGSDLEV